ncbi:hypothetical protein ACFQ0M_10785 [Kitasatospora aburaviensis]
MTTGTTAYDGYGRTIGATDVTSTDSANPNGATATTSYGSANPGELPNQTVTGTPAPAGAPDAGAKRTTTVTLNPARALPLTTTDPNARTVTQSYDGLGRLKAVWTPGRATSESANYTFDYSVDGTARPSAVTSRTLRSGGKDAVSTQIMDGLGRVVQTQTDPAISAYHGRLVTDTFYDSQGRTNRAYATYYDDTSAPNAVRFNATAAQVPGQSYTEFDGMGRPVSSQFIALGVLQNTTTTAYPGADRVDVTPPGGATATSMVTDARGRTAQLWQYRTPNATGKQTDAEVTTYTYTAGGQAATRTDAAGNSWSYGYDQRGRQVRADDPDTGVSTRTYDGAGRLATTTDARNQTIAVTYDLLGRKTGTYNGTVAPGNQLTGYTYDTVAKGQPASSTRYVGGATGSAYTKAVTTIDDAYRPTKTTVSIPGSEIGQSGQQTFEYEAVYDPITGAVTNEYRAAAGNLADESINYKYEAYGLLHDMSGAGDVYLRQSDWDAYGRNIRSTVNPFGWQIVATNTYDESTGRLLTQYIDKQTATNGTVQNTTYAYNQAGQITAIRTIPNNTPRPPTCSASPTTTSAASPPRGATPADSTSPPLPHRTGHLRQHHPHQRRARPGEDHGRRQRRLLAGLLLRPDGQPHQADQPRPRRRRGEGPQDRADLPRPGTRNTPTTAPEPAAAPADPTPSPPPRTPSAGARAPRAATSTTPPATPPRSPTPAATRNSRPGSPSSPVSRCAPTAPSSPCRPTATSSSPPCAPARPCGPPTPRTTRAPGRPCRTTATSSSTTPSAFRSGPPRPGSATTAGTSRSSRTTASSWSTPLAGKPSGAPRRGTPSTPPTARPSPGTSRASSPHSPRAAPPPATSTTPTATS